jgi:predicted ATP-grasp superfamily ATP-dependent carboligase
VGFRQQYGRQAVICERDAEVEEAYGQMEAWEPMVQDLIPGGDDELYSLGAYLSEALEPLGLFCGRKVRQTPPGIGTARLAEAVWVQEVVDAGVELMRTLGCNGLAQVEYKRDPRDGRFKLMEINPRLWQWHSLATACGVDLTLIAYRDQTGERVEPVQSNGRRRTWALALMPNERPLLPRPPFVEPTVAWDDPKPALVHAARVALRAVRR